MKNTPSRGEHNPPAELSSLERRLIDALKHKNLDSFKACLKDGANPNVKIDGVPILLNAAFLGELAFVKSLLVAGADPNIRMGNVPALIWIVWFAEAPAHVESAAALIDGGADMKIKTLNILGTATGTAMDMAVASGKKDMALMLHGRRAPCTKATLINFKALAKSTQQESGGPSI